MLPKDNRDDAENPTQSMESMPKKNLTRCTLLVIFT